MMANFLTLEGEKAVFARGGLVKRVKALLPFHLYVLICLLGLVSFKFMLGSEAWPLFASSASSAYSMS